MFWKSATAALLVGLLAGPAGALVHTDVLDYEVRLPQSQVAPLYSTPTEAHATQLLPALADFRAREGSDWRILHWDPMRGTPASLAGPAIPMVGSEASEEAIRSAVEAFIARNADLLKVDPRQMRVQEIYDIAEGRKYVIAQQFVDGIPVIFGRLDIALWEGKVVLVGSEAFSDVQVNRFPLLDAAAAGRHAHQGIPSHADDRVEGTPRLVILPLDENGRYRYHLAYELVLKTHEPDGLWRTYVDAHNGAVLWRQSDYAYFEITGTVRGDVEETFNNPFNYPLQHARVRASGTYTGYTNLNGEFSITVPSEVPYNNQSELYGRWCNVNRYDGTPDASITITGAPGTPINFYYDESNSAWAERDTYYHTNIVHDWIKGLDPAFTRLDYVMSANVELSGTCNAFWNGYSINFYRAGAGCNSTGRIADVIYHEYGHGITQELYWPQGPPTSSGMGEGFSDITAFCIHPDPLVGEWFYTNGNPVRNAENLRQYPGSECGGQVHCLGEIIMGAMWKARKNFVIKYGEPAVPAIYDDLYIRTVKTKQTTMPNFLNRLLLNNDTDGNLANGTRDWYEICEAFALHNLPCPPLTNYVVVTSTPIEDQPQDTGGYVVTAIAESIGGGAIDPNGVKIYYTTEPVDFGTNWLQAPMAPTGNPNEYRGEIPNQGCGEIINYYVRAQKLTGEFATAPFLAPYRGTYEFMTGPTEVSLTDDLEIDRGWTLGWAGDNATEGHWERTDPVGKYSGIYGDTQPEDDHTPGAATQCFVTDGRGGLWFAYDVDNGVTSVVSPSFNWAGKTGVASVRFWSFFVDVPYSDDALRLHLSNDDGATWTEVWQQSGTEQNMWLFHKVYVKSDDVPFTSTMRFRFTMEDINLITQCAEAALDDILIKVNTCFAADAAASELPVRFTVEQNRPNPFNPQTAIRFGLPQTGRVEATVYDASGRSVRSLADGTFPAGYHTLVWDGRDDQGHPVGSGVYYYSVRSEGNEASHKMMLLK